MLSWVFAAGVCAKHGFFGLVPWYQYLDYGRDPVTGSCAIQNFVVVESGKSSSIPLILLAIVDDLLRIAGIVAIGFVIYGAIKYTTSQGVPDQTAQAQSTIINALIGLVVAMIGVGLISFIGRSLN
ncbi:hypothetical protein BH09PAT4_BH09PAT4_03350 [soil metagenome]